MGSIDKSLLPIIRYFLPRLTKEDLAVELNQANAARTQRAKESITNAKEAASKRRIRLKQLHANDLRSTHTFTLLYILLIPVLGLGILLLLQASSKRKRIDTHYEQKHTEATQQESSEIAQINAQLKKDNLLLTDSLWEMTDAYARSIASDEEVDIHIQHALDKVRESINPALGISESDVVDEKCAETIIPSFLVVDDLPKEVQRDIILTTLALRENKEAIVNPFTSRFPDLNRMDEFMDRIYQLLGIDDHQEINSGFEAGGLISIQYNSHSEAFVSGHCYLQQIVCAPDFVGVFQVFVNLLIPGIPIMIATQLFYQEVVSTRIESHQTRRRYSWSNLEIDKHTKSLVLSTSDGRQYRLSADAGSTAFDLNAPEASTDSYSSLQDPFFDAQIASLRALIRDTRRHLMHNENKPIP